MIRIAILAVVAAGGLSSIEPAHAQMRNPNFPVCLQVYGPANYYECRYTSIAQCNQQASGRAAQCIVNPYFAGGFDEDEAPRQRRRRAY